MASSYSPKEVETLIDVYTENPCLEVVSKLSIMLNRPKKSIISKLSKEGVYITRGYRSKTGGVPITKLQLVHSIEDALDIKLPDLAKAPKGTLQSLSDTIIEMAQMLENTLHELKDTSEVTRTREEIFNILENKKG